MPARPNTRERFSAVDCLRLRRVPFMARRNYILEVQHLLLWGLFAGLVEGTVSAVVVAKTFGGSELLITTVNATPAIANLVSLYWGALIVGRRKLACFMAFGAASLAATLAVAITPQSHWGGWLFAGQILLSRVFMSGVVTARASLWKSNYPRSHRGRITAGLQVVRTAMSLPVIFGGGLLFDARPEAYHWFYPAIAAAGALGLLVFRKEHVRGEKARLSGRTREDAATLADPAVSEPFSLVAMVMPWRLLRRMRQTLRDDPKFARYCKAQMCIGVANLLVIPVNTIVMTRQLNLSYFAANGLLDGIPRVVILLMLPVWARMFDRVGVLRFRAVNTLCWCGSLALCGAGAWCAERHEAGAMGFFGLSMVAYVLGRLCDGAAQSGGAIAWNIGHLHFVEDDQAELYMGIHVSLTGVRGLVAPFAGVLLYQTAGVAVFVVGFVISVIGWKIFANLAREEVTTVRR